MKMRPTKTHDPITSEERNIAQAIRWISAAVVIIMVSSLGGCEYVRTHKADRVTECAKTNDPQKCHDMIYGAPRR